MYFISVFRNIISKIRYMFPILCVLFLFSCQTTERIVYQTRVETVRDTVVITEPDSSFIKVLLRCDSLEQIFIETLLEYEGGNKLKPPEVEIKNNVLTAKCKTDTVYYSFPIYTIEIKEQEIKIIDNTKYRFGENFFYWSGITLYVFLILLIAFLSVRFFAK